MADRKQSEEDRKDPGSVYAQGIYKLYDMFKVFGEKFENEIIDTESTKFPVSIINGSQKFENMSHTFMY